MITYSRHRDANGAIAPILMESGSGFDASEVDSPMVVVDPDRPGGDKFVMYYEATSSAGVSTIGVVTSRQEEFRVLGVPRTRAVGLGGAGSGFDVGATDPTVFVDRGVPFNTVGRYRMWFEGRSGPQGRDSRIISCASADGVTWSGFTQCTGLDPAFGSVRVADPTVTADGGLWRMWFEAVGSTTSSGADGQALLGHADSTDGVHWIVRDAAGRIGGAATAVLGAGPPGRFDAYSVHAPSVLIDETRPNGHPRRFLLWFEASDVLGPTESTIGFAASPDGLTWQVFDMPVLRPSSDSLVPLPFDSGDLEHPTALLDHTVSAATEGHYLLWYTGDGEGNASPNRIGLATGSDTP